MEEVQPSAVQMPAHPSLPAAPAAAVAQSSGFVKFLKDSFAGTVGELVQERSMQPASASSVCTRKIACSLAV